MFFDHLKSDNVYIIVLSLGVFNTVVASLNQLEMSLTQTCQLRWAASVNLVFYFPVVMVRPSVKDC